MAEYILTLEQFKEFVAPFLKKMNNQFIKNEHRQLAFYVSIPCSGGLNLEKFEIEYCVVGYYTFGRILINVQNCYNLDLNQVKNGPVDIDGLQEEMQEALWKYCYNLFGADYKEDLFQFMVLERENRIKELNEYIKGIENAEISDMDIVENEIKAARDEIAYLDQYYDNILEQINALGPSSTCN